MLYSSSNYASLVHFILYNFIHQCTLLLCKFYLQISQSCRTKMLSMMYKKWLKFEIQRRQIHKNPLLRFLLRIFFPVCRLVYLICFYKVIFFFRIHSQNWSSKLDFWHHKKEPYVPIAKLQYLFRSISNFLGSKIKSVL